VLSRGWIYLPNERSPGTVLIAVLAIAYTLGLLLFNIGWFSFDLINKHELAFHLLSSKLIGYGQTLNVQGILSEIISQGEHPFLPVLLFSVFKGLAVSSGLGEVLALRVFYFVCYAIILVSSWYLAWRYSTLRRTLAGLLSLLFALSSPMVFQTLFEGQDPEDLVANMFLLLCLSAYLSYRLSLAGDQGGSGRRALLVSFLLGCSFFSKYNVGVFLGASIALDLFIGTAILKRLQLGRLKLLHLVAPFLLTCLVWLCLPTVLTQMTDHISMRMEPKTSGQLDRLYYIKVLLTATGPNLPVVDGVWRHKFSTDLQLLTHWGQGALALLCLALVGWRLAGCAIRRSCPNGFSLLGLPVIYVVINLVFFSISSYRLPTALISTVPVLWLITGAESARLTGYIAELPTVARRAGWMSRIPTASLLLFLFSTVCIQAGGISLEMNRFIGHHENGPSDLKRLTTDSHRVVSQIETLADRKGCTNLLVIQEGKTFFEEYFSKLLEYRLQVHDRGFRFVEDWQVREMADMTGAELLVVRISVPPPGGIDGRPYDHSESTHTIAFRGRRNEIVVRYLSGRQLHDATYKLEQSGTMNPHPDTKSPSSSPSE